MLRFREHPFDTDEGAIEYAELAGAGWLFCEWDRDGDECRAYGRPGGDLREQPTGELFCSPHSDAAAELRRRMRRPRRVSPEASARALDLRQRTG